MQELERALSGALHHHAFLLEGELRTLATALGKAFLAAGIPVRGNPDVHTFSAEQFGIEDAHDLSRTAALTGAGERKFFVIETSGFTREAQNALLKLLEEPSRTCTFFILVPSASLLLPTLTSRLFRLGTVEGGLEEELAREVFEASLPKRLELVARLIEEKDRAAARSFLESCERLLYVADKKKGREELRASEAVYKDLIRFRSLLAQPGSSVKMVLEHIVLALPQVRRK